MRYVMLLLPYNKVYELKPSLVKKSVFEFQPKSYNL